VGRVDCSNIGARKANSDETKHPESHSALNVGTLGVIGSKHTDHNRQCLFGKGFVSGVDGIVLYCPIT
jgi:hypothetical protein